MITVIKNERKTIMRYNGNNAAYAFMGRIDFEKENEPLFIYAGSMVKLTFTGTSAKIFIKNVNMHTYCSIGAVLDGVQQCIQLADSADEQEFVIAENLEDKEHTLIVFKRQAAANYFYFCGFETDGKVVPTKPFGDFKIEVFGDSVSAGEVCEAVYYEGMPDPADHGSRYDNAWFAYPLVLARKLGAQVNDNSQGGIALFDGTGYFYDKGYVGLESTYDKLRYVPYAPLAVNGWDFSRYTPDLVIFAIGQNDANPDPKAIYKEEYARKWLDKYEEIIGELAERYPEARFILMTTVLRHDRIWDEVLDRACAEMNEKIAGGRFERHIFRRNGDATDGHPRITEQEEMANELYLHAKEMFSDKL